MVPNLLEASQTNKRIHWLVLFYLVCCTFALVYLPVHFAIVVALLPFALAFALNCSELLLIAFVLFSYFRIHEAFPVLMPLKLPKLFALASLFAVCWHTWISCKITPYWGKLHTVFMVVFVWLTVSVLFASNRGLAMEAWKEVLIKVLIMVFVISWWFKDMKVFAYTRIGIMFSGTLVAIVAISNRINEIGLVEGTRVTISRSLGSQLGDPNDLSLVLMFPVSFVAAEVFNSDNSKLRRLIALCCLITLISAIICTQSRGGLLGIVAILGYFTYQKIKNPVLLISLAVPVLLALAVVAGISERASGGAAEDGIDESAMGRIYAWQAAFNMALSNPITGVGVKNFYVNYFFYSPHWDGKNHAVHSTWFQVLGETGFVGLVLFIVLIASIYRTLSQVLLKAKQFGNAGYLVNGNALMSGLIGFCVAGTFLTQAFTWPLYIILSLTIALEQLVKTHITKEERDVSAS